MWKTKLQSVKSPVHGLMCDYKREASSYGNSRRYVEQQEKLMRTPGSFSLTWRFPATRSRTSGELFFLCRSLYFLRRTHFRLDSTVPPVHCPLPLTVIPPTRLPPTRLSSSDATSSNAGVHCPLRLSSSPAHCFSSEGVEQFIPPSTFDDWGGLLVMSCHLSKSLELASVRLKGVGANISNVFGNFNQASKEIFKTTVFEPFIWTPSFKGEGFLCHMMLLHEIQPTEESVAEKRMYFRVGEKTISYGAKEFCLITGFLFGKNIEPKKMFKFKGTQSKFGARVFPNTPEAEGTVSQLGQLLQKALDMLDIQDVDVVRLGLLYILCKGF
ncbi:hypothetical protein LXL04_031638 [Taraxacum kok-saghyz]